MKLESLSLQCLKFYHKFNENSCPKYLGIFSLEIVRCALTAQMLTNVSDIRNPIYRLRSPLMYAAILTLLVWKGSIIPIRHLFPLHLIQFVIFVIAISVIIHYCDIIMGTVASQITSLTISYSTVYSDADQRTHQSSASLAFVQGIHRWIPRTNDQ